MLDAEFARKLSGLGNTYVLPKTLQKIEDTARQGQERVVLLDEDECSQANLDALVRLGYVVNTWNLGSATTTGSVKW